MSLETITPKKKMNTTRLSSSILSIAACVFFFVSLPTTSALATTSPFGALASGPLFTDVCATNPYKLDDEQREYCGEHSYPLTSVHQIAYGGTAYVYDVAESPVEVIIPPDSFNALTASEEERAAFSIPGPPSQDWKEYVTWRNNMENLHFPAAPDELISGSNRHEEEEGNIKWSGYRAEQEGDFTPAAAVHFDEPEERRNGCGPEEADFWVGISGASGDGEKLAQDGTEIGPFLENGKGYAWWELITPYTESHENERHEALSLPFYYWNETRGDTLEVEPEHEVYFEVGDGLEDKVGFYMEYESSGYIARMYNGGESLPEEWADYIVESNKYHHLREFTDFNMLGELFKEGSWHGMSEAGSREKYRMVREGTTLAHASGLYGNEFSNYWDHC